jgi:hypothetical protein
MLFATWLCRSLTSDEPHGKLVAKPEDSAGCAYRPNTAKRHVGPIRELLREQTLYERLVNLELVGEHSLFAHEIPCRA